MMIFGRNSELVSTVTITDSYDILKHAYLFPNQIRIIISYKNYTHLSNFQSSFVPTGTAQETLHIQTSVANQE